jgi:cytochrome c biogenesis protein CcmG, thiol:disulfide interchange protein DsbE
MVDVVPELQLGCRGELKLAALIAVAFSALTLSPAAADQQPSLRNAPAPPIALPIIANGSGAFILKQHLGHPVYINFFASWCQPCQEEARTIQKVTAEFAGSDIRVIGIAVLDDPSKAKHFVQGHALRYPIAFDRTGDVGAAYRLNELPLHVFIGADGVIKQYVEGGPIPESELREGLAEIAKTR